MNYTSIEQSKKLLELGLKAETADMTYFAITEGERNKMVIKDWKAEIGLNSAITNNLFSYRNGYVIPCWSVGTLLELISSIRIEDEDIPRTMLWVTYDGWSIDWKISNIYYNESGKTPIEACYNMIVWLLQNNYIKTK